LPTKAEIRRFEALVAHGCVACHLVGREGCGRVEVHHIVDNGYRRLSGGHMATLPLGSYHHRGQLPKGMGRREAHVLYGPSLADGSKKFAARFGSQRELLERVNIALYGQAAIPLEGSAIDDVD
jgi:cytochrome c551/c552